MTIYTKETALYNTGAIANDIGAAGETASKYITTVTNDGVMVADVNKGASSGGAITSSTYGVHIASDVDIVRGGVSVAKYGEATRIGGLNGRHLEADSGGVSILSDSTTVMAEFGYGEVNDSSMSATTAPYFVMSVPISLSSTTAWSSSTAYSVGDVVKYSDKLYVCDTANTNKTPSTASSYWSLLYGAYSMASGGNSIASGYNSHAEGGACRALGGNSHAEGAGTIASSEYSHAEGYHTWANHYGAHAEGRETKANGQYSHAGGYGTIAQHYQMAIGQFNVADNSGSPVYALIIGNGTSDSARSNAFAVDTTGDIYPQNTKMADFVVAQGTSGIWTYRKWNSGIAECWGKFTKSIAVNTSATSYGGYRSDQVTVDAYPTNLFNAAPTVLMTACNSQGYWVNNADSGTSTNAKFFLSCGNSLSAATRGVFVQAMGKWK